MPSHDVMPNMELYQPVQVEDALAIADRLAERGWIPSLSGELATHMRSVPWRSMKHSISVRVQRRDCTRRHGSKEGRHTSERQALGRVTTAAMRTV